LHPQEAADDVAKKTKEFLKGPSSTERVMALSLCER